jgi:vacuolar-type H+-ATPase subunit F/Vma7
MVVVVSSSLVSRFRLRSVVAIEEINLQERKKNRKTSISTRCINLIQLKERLAKKKGRTSDNQWAVN